MMLKSTTALFAVALLAACGGGGSGGGSALTFQTLGNEGIALLNQFDGAPATLVQNLPTGTFNYSGVAAYSAINSNDPNAILNNAVALSSIDLNANFTNNSITGTLSNFVDDLNYTASGTVPLTGTILGNGFSASGSGVLVSSFDNSNVLASATISQGVFIGNQAEGAEGIMAARYGNISGSGYFLAAR